MSKTIGIFVGSLRKGSYNKTIAEAIASYLPAGYDGRIIEMGTVEEFKNSANPIVQQFIHGWKSPVKPAQRRQKI